MTKARKAAFNIQLLRETWKIVEKAGLKQVGLVLFEKTFEIAPQALNLFSFSDDVKDCVFQSQMLEAHAWKVMESLNQVITLLDNVPLLAMVLKKLGSRHVAYGAQVAHYNVVGEALLLTLAQVLGDAWTPEARAEWTQTYGEMVELMLSGAESSTPNSPALQEACVCMGYLAKKNRAKTSSSLASPEDRRGPGQGKDPSRGR